MTTVSHAADAVASLLANRTPASSLPITTAPNRSSSLASENAIQATEKLRQAAIRFQRLPVSTHATRPLYARSGALPRLFWIMSTSTSRMMPVYTNSMAAVYSNVPDAIRFETLASQIAEPVRFSEQIEAMYAAGVRTFVEVDPAQF